MDVLPRPAKRIQVFQQSCFDSGYFASREAIVFAHDHWASGTIQLEYSLMIHANDVNVRWAMIVRIDHYAKTAKPENGWHKNILS